jgi:hypothetical protein
LSRTLARAMTNIIQAKVRIEGIRTLAIHSFGVDSLPLEARERSGVAGNDPSEWERTVLMDESRQLYLLPTYAFSCLKAAGKTLRRGKSNLSAPIASTLQILDDRIYLTREGAPVKLPDPPKLIEAGKVSTELLPPAYIEVIGVRNPSTKARNIRYRAALKPGWQCDFTLLWDKTVVDRSAMELCCINSGQLVGLADGRGIGYGRFNVLNFEVA